LGASPTPGGRPCRVASFRRRRLILPIFILKQIRHIEFFFLF
jgi:hypothetical protein